MTACEMVRGVRVSYSFEACAAVDAKLAHHDETVVLARVVVELSRAQDSCAVRLTRSPEVLSLLEGAVGEVRQERR